MSKKVLIADDSSVIQTLTKKNSCSTRLRH